ncbi:BaiN/RdsA family NAD(P)/FAD-dependent oxidoreductase [Anaeromicropila herbilytica]|uniref:Aminoacetone oxidase family FAD-binding enzyme n=1 Tax=Anaeromicropila herbilytica TaxID=2785025 RepID=A0A7R7EL36_9FIRM|nr:NAD(P)/FAD-dependent oxidoreductase [Anaeromicropila herbilytica]BCN30586.1 aminoacetone oxidase family FAD-binding enzyme [Anaeromicropila herbilytica]
MKTDVIIVGGGASGLVAAIVSARCGKNVTIIEQKDRVGKKILATGNGKCNYTNSLQTEDCYRGEDSSYAFKVLSFFGVSETVTFFKELGIYPKIKNGYYYPNSEQASSVLDVLRIELERLKVNVVTEEEVIKVEQNNSIGNSKKTANNCKDLDFIVTTSSKKYYAKSLIMATGGCASPELGSNGSGYDLLKKFSHKVIKPVPALVQLKAKGNYFKTLAGVRNESSISLYIEDQFIRKEYGELQLTNYGVSGIPIFQLSRYAARAIDERKSVHLTIDFLPQLSENELYQNILERTELERHKTIEELLLGLLNKKLSYVIIKEAMLDPIASVNVLNKKSIQQLVKRMKEFMVEITEPNSFSNAQVTAGGISTKDIDPKTMESKLVKNLYIVGELIDIDGICGGYNLQWAWTTGYLAGLAVGGSK